MGRLLLLQTNDSTNENVVETSNLFGSSVYVPLEMSSKCNFINPRNMAKVRPLHSQADTESMHSFITSRLDYCRSLVLSALNSCLPVET